MGADKDRVLRVRGAGTHEVGRVYSPTCPRPHTWRKARDGQLSALFRAYRGDCQEPSYPANQIHAGSLSGVPWAPIFSPALKNAVSEPHMSLPNTRRKELRLVDKRAGVSHVSLPGF